MLLWSGTTYIQSQTTTKQPGGEMWHFLLVILSPLQISLVRNVGQP